MCQTLFELKNISVYYKHISWFFRSNLEKYALKNISFSIAPGECIGIIGKNGAGKTTLLRLLCGIISADKGTVVRHTSKIAMLSIGAGFDNYLTGNENIGLNGRLLGMSRNEINNARPHILELSGLNEAINMPVRTYSTGMRSRLGFAIAYYANPDVLLMDENLGVGDFDFQKKSSLLIKKKIQAPNQTAILTSHNIALIREICSRVIWLENGELRGMGDTAKITQEYLRNV